MAYISPENKATIKSQLLPILEKWELKGTLSIDNHSTLILTVTEGAIDFHGDYDQDHRTWGADGVFHVSGAVTPNGSLRVDLQRMFKGNAKEALTDILVAMNKGNHDRSDTMTDLFDVGWYTEVRIGRQTWAKGIHTVKPYRFTRLKAAAQLEETATDDTPPPGDKRDHLRQAMAAYLEARAALDQAFDEVNKETLQAKMQEIRDRRKDVETKAITFKDAYFEATLDANTCAQVRDTPIHELLELAKNMLSDAPAPGQRRKTP